ncbi:MAG: response regulator [Polyangiaceae bacterium]
MSRRDILLVEDDQHVRRAMTRLLRREGRDVTACDSVDEAIHTLESDGSFDLAILDLEVADELGLDVADHLDEGTRIVFFTGSVDPSLLGRARARGAVVRKDRPEHILAELERLPRRA